ncbi:MAG: TetR/AcrR family transcriptional regulator [Cyclobacteriaceae bacterium]
MSDKATQTKALILEKVAPVFNRKGFVATSLSDLTEATGMTKGAIYCHFENKEDLAVQAYKVMLKNVLSPLSRLLQAESEAVGKLNALIQYYRDYSKLSKFYGGCPIINIGVSTQYTNSKLFQLAKNVSKRLEEDLKHIIVEGIEEEYLSQETEPAILAGKIFSMIEGGVFMSMLHHDSRYLSMMMDEAEKVIQANKRK